DDLRREWARARVSAASDMASHRQRSLVSLALQLADAEDRAGSPARARAVLETALEALPDDGHRHMVFCRMAMAAARGGGIGSAEAWLGLCDPAAEVAELDSAYREAAAFLRRAKGDPTSVLAIIGTRADEMPTAPSFVVRFHMLRSDALEALERYDAA